MRSATGPVDTAPHTRRVARHRDRQVAALVISLVLLAVATVAALWVANVPHEHHVPSLVAAACAIGVVALFVWSGIGPRRGLMRDLEAAEERYRTMVEQLPAVLYVADFGAEATWHYVSPRIHDLLGYSAEEWTADPKLWMAHIHPDDRQQVLEDENFDGRRELGSRSVSEYRMRRRDGREVWVRDEGVVIGDERGEPAQYRGFMIDITPAEAGRAGAP